MWKVPASHGLWTVWHLHTGIFFACDIKTCWKTPEPGTTVHTPSPYKALLTYSVVLLWCKTAVQPVSLRSWCVKDIHTLQKADHHNSLFSSSPSRRPCPQCPSHMRSSKWGSCPGGGWSAASTWEEPAQPHLGTGPQGARSVPTAMCDLICDKVWA